MAYELSPSQVENKESYRLWIRNSEERLISYKKLLEESFRNGPGKDASAKELEFHDWWKAHLRECKNSEEVCYKKLRREFEYVKDGIDPPFDFHNLKNKEI